MHNKKNTEREFCVKKKYLQIKNSWRKKTILKNMQQSSRKKENYDFLIQLTLFFCKGNASKSGKLKKLWGTSY